MGRHKLTKTKAKLTGADRKNPSRYKSVEPVVDFNIGKPPTHMNAEEVKAWKEIIGAVPEGVAAKSDRIMLELSSCLLAQMRVQRIDFPSSKQNSLISCLSKFGLTPIDRQKLGVGQTGEDEEGWGDL